MATFNSIVLEAEEYDVAVDIEPDRVVFTPMAGSTKNHRTLDTYYLGIMYQQGTKWNAYAVMSQHYRSSLAEKKPDSVPIEVRRSVSKTRAANFCLSVAVDGV